MDRTVDQTLLRALRDRYEEWSDDQLAATLARDASDLTETAQQALAEVVALRDRPKIEQHAADIRERQQRARVEPPTAFSHRPEDLEGVLSGYWRSVYVARWLAFVLVALQAGAVHGVVLRLLGVARSADFANATDEHLFAFGATGVITMLFSMAVGLWVCPSPRKARPALILCAVSVAAGVFKLVTYSRPEFGGGYQRLMGVDTILSMATSVMVAGTLLLTSRRPAMPARRGVAD